MTLVEASTATPSPSQGSSSVRSIDWTLAVPPRFRRTQARSGAAKPGSALLLLCFTAAGLLAPAPAGAILNVRIFDDGPNLKVTVDGMLSALPGVKDVGSCGADGTLTGQNPTNGNSFSSVLCTGPNVAWNLYTISGPSGFGGTGFLLSASSVSGSPFGLIPSSFGLCGSPDSAAFCSTIGLPQNYIPGNPFFSSATFNNRSLASEGFPATGVIGPWQLTGTTETINLYFGSSGAEPIPGPLPLLGAGAAFVWSRRMRRRIRSAPARPPQV